MKIDEGDAEARVKKWYCPARRPGHAVMLIGHVHIIYHQLLTSTKTLDRNCVIGQGGMPVYGMMPY
jgi:hypothetical protein